MNENDPKRDFVSSVVSELNLNTLSGMHTIINRLFKISRICFSLFALSIRCNFREYF